MNDLTSNLILDKLFRKVRTKCEMIKSKQFERDIKKILASEKIIDYRCYLRQDQQIIYYVAETKTDYIVYKEDLRTREQEAYIIKKEELE